MKQNLKIKINFSDKDISDIKQFISDSKDELTGLKVRIEATHSGKVNKNKFFYTPLGMRDGVKSLVEPYQKPILTEHNPDSPAIGRIVDSEYVMYRQYDNDQLAQTINNAAAKDLVATVNSFVNSDTYKSEGYKGLGHIDVIADIVDKDAMEKIIDKRYLTVSVSGGVDSAICNICGADKISDSSSCEHWRGETYDGIEMFLIGGNMRFNELSYVNQPADDFTGTEIIQDSCDEFMNGTIEIIDYIVQSGEQHSMKKTLKEVIENASQYLSDAFKDLGLDEHSLQDTEYSALRKTSFLFANDRAVPINDKAHILAAFHIMDQVEDSEEKSQALTVLNRKFEKEFGKDVSIEDAIALVKTPDPAEGDEGGTDADKELTASIVKIINDSIPLISDAVVLKLKDNLQVSDSYSSERIEALESEIEALESEFNTINDKYRSLVVEQILIAEKKVEDSEYRERLTKRSLVSLSDKLEDLGISVVPNKEDNQEGIADADLDAAAAAAAAAEQEKGNIEDSEENSDEPKPLTVNEIRDEYKKIFKEKGISAANRYIKDLEDSDKLPKNFTF